ncbi:DUF7940 domain-containing protein [Sphingomonas sp. TX0522]|uniref:DUF7940 domain-containing protein n=1 Tax=Sphingomonas sp. TX0522 TaxID=2479205 RepID=UPI0018E05C30|nr:hypothetical protein [Sphingomonas sp. TX0522]MBI0533249.1 hypothetical protein [Sphingomonas sp. TX0522]
MKLIDGWRQSWRLWSVRVSALGAILTGLALAAPDFLQNLWNGLPSDARALLPASVTHAVPPILFVLTLVSRLVAQGDGASPTSSGSVALDEILNRMLAAERAINDLHADVVTNHGAATHSAMALATRLDALPAQVTAVALDTASGTVRLDTQDGRITGFQVGGDHDADAR